VQKFGDENFSGQTISINLEKNPDWHSVFEKDLDAKRILAELSVLSGKKISENTLLFLDEVQSCPRAIMALRYF
jgi:predicted AAA+ superfamily ATPase